jgi:autotransporter adhesin
MLGNATFYNRTIRKIVVAFGTVFNDIYLVRYTKDGVTAKETIKVPLNWGAKEKYITRITSDPNLTKSIATTLPRISFEMTGMSYDSSRKLPTTVRNFSANNATTVNAQYVPVPYNFDFSLSIYVRNTEDGTQILEQILPFFTPDFSVTVDFIPLMDPKYDMPIILNSVSNEVDYEGDMMATRLIIWNLEFTAKSHIWPPVKTGKIINVANTNLYIQPNSLLEQQVFVDFANGVGRFSDSETIRVTDRDVHGTVSYFSNVNNGILIVESLNDYLAVGDVVRGDFTGATYTIKTADKTPLKSTTITTRPKPLTAEPDDEFGFSETVTTGRTF